MGVTYKTITVKDRCPHPQQTGDCASQAEILLQRNGGCSDQLQQHDCNIFCYSHGDFVGDIWIKNINLKIRGGKNLPQFIVLRNGQECEVWDNSAGSNELQQGDTYEFSAQVRRTMQLKLDADS
jgi:hypothetical protein